VTAFNDESLPFDEANGKPADYIGVLSIGITGEMYQSTRAVLSAFGLTFEESQRLMKTLHIAACKDTTEIMIARWRLDNGITPTPPNASSQPSHPQAHTSTPNSNPPDPH